MGQAAKRAVRPGPRCTRASTLRSWLGVVEADEPVVVDPLVAKRPGETLAVAVLDGLTQSDEVDLQPAA